jgi:hypothetical protein
MLQPPEGIAVENPVPVPLEIGAERVLLLFPIPLCMDRKGCPMAEYLLLNVFTPFPNQHKASSFAGTSCRTLWNSLNVF